MSGGSDDFGDKFAIKFNKNTFALTPVKPSFVTEAGILEPGVSRRAEIPLKIDPENASKGVAPNLVIQMAMKTQKTGNVAYFTGNLPFYVLFLENPPQVDWNSQSNNSVEGYSPKWPVMDPTSALAASNVVSVGNNMFVFTTSTGSNCICQLGPNSRVEVRCSQRQVLPFALDGLLALLVKIAETQAVSAPSTKAPSSNPSDNLLDLF